MDIKDDRSPVTAADKAAHDVILQGLQQLTPDLPVLSEESKQIPYSERQRWESYWLVDPLDGTKEFISRNGDFTINIALIQKHAPVVGLVHIPVENLSYYGVVGAGAYRRDQRVRRHGRSGCGPLGGRAVRVVASRSHRGPLLDGYLAKLGAHETLSRGSALKFCLVAEGAADVYPRLGPTCEWDTGAGHAVLLAAGGQVTAVDGTALATTQKNLC